MPAEAGDSWQNFTSVSGGDKSPEQPTTIQCPSCKVSFLKSEMVYLDEEDTQGYSATGWYCESCAESTKYEAFQLEDEDLYDIEDD